MTNWSSDEDREKISALFMPYAAKKFEKAKQTNVRFSHYTSADAALKIIKSKTVWLRNAIVMNDFSEIQYGLDMLRGAWNDENLGGAVNKLITYWWGDLREDIEEAYSSQSTERENQTYMLSVSEHGDPTNEVNEDQLGRLSMWRAYGGKTNVAFVFNNTPFLAPTSAINAFTSPVLYADENRYRHEFRTVLHNLSENVSLIKDLERDQIVSLLSQAFHFSTLSTKHPGFSEEREWRVIYSPEIYRSEHISIETEVIDGVPQKVCKLPLKNIPEEGHVGATIPELLEKLIIGPTQYPWPIYEAFHDALTAAGVSDVSSKISISNIPLRR